MTLNLGTGQGLRDLQILSDTLEPLVDRFGLPDVVVALAEVVSAKSDHVRHAWQDHDYAARLDHITGHLLQVTDEAVEAQRQRLERGWIL